MASPAVTYSFSNGTTADATQVNQNFTDLIASLTDGTKSLVIDALTASGAAIFNGAVTLGNGTADDITITGSLAASVPIKTNNSFDIGSSTLGLAGVYLGSSGGLTTRVIGGATGSSWTLTLPTAVPAAAKSVMTVDTSGVAGFENRGIESLTAQTATYSVLASDQIVTCSGASFTNTLPAASASNSGKVVTFIHDDATAGRIYTITDGTLTKKISTQGESLEVYSTGAAWKVGRRYIPADVSSWTPTGSWSANTTYTGLKWRVGSYGHYRVKVATSGAPTSASLTVNLPSAEVIDTTKLVDTAAGAYAQLGYGTISDTGVQIYAAHVGYSSTTAVGVTTPKADGTNVYVSAPITQAVPMTFGNTDYLDLYFSAPITDWEG